MKKDTISLSIEEVHRCIWNESASKFVIRLGLDQVDLKRQCKALGIPTPTSGYWSRLSFNKPVEITPLPATLDAKKNIHLKLKTKKKPKITPVEPDAILVTNGKASPKASKSKDEHPLIKQTREVFKERRKRKPGYWSERRDERNFLSIHVQPENEERALKIFNAILVGVTERGYKVTTGHGWNTIVEVEEVKIPIRMREKNKRVLKKDSTSSWDRFDYLPTGILVFVSEYESYHRKEYYDKPFVKLEEKTDQIIENIIKEGIFETRQKQKWEIERKLQEERRVKENARRKLVNEELKKFTALVPLQHRWHQARILREYLNAYEKHLQTANHLTSERMEWLAWARKKADWYDPFVEATDESLEGIDRVSLEPLRMDGSYW